MSALIYLVDDDRDFLDLLESILSGAGHRVIAFSNPQSALAALDAAARQAAELPSVLITDLMMKALDSGFSLAAAIRADPRLRTVRLIIVSAVASQTRVRLPSALRARPGVHARGRLLRQTRGPTGPAGQDRRASEMTGSPSRILVVDDELGVREGCRKILASEGYDVVTAGDGKAGLEQFLERGPFSAMLVDLQMPRMSGLELMREVRSRDEDIGLHHHHRPRHHRHRRGRHAPGRLQLYPQAFHRRTSSSLPSRTAWSGAPCPWRPSACVTSASGASWSWPPSALEATRSSPA